MTRSGALLITIYVLIVLFLVIGEIKCIIHLIQCDFKPSYKAEVLYGVDAVTGLGGIFGWFNFGK